jgi:transposase
MGKRVKKAIPRIFHWGLNRVRDDAAGIDVGAEEIWVDVGERDPEPVRRFATFTADLTTMSKWMKGCGIQTVAMESTGVYWIPVCQILESHGLEVLLVNARHVKNVSGRKDDMLDCQWLRVLHSYGLLSGSFRPAQQIGVLRTYMRHRQGLVEGASREILHMQKAMTEMNLQLHHVLSDIAGVTGMLIVRAIVGGERDPKKLAALRDGRTKADEATIAKALEGNYRDEQLFLLKQSLELFDNYQEKIQRCDKQIADYMETLERKADSAGIPAARASTSKGRNRPRFNVREVAFGISGVDFTRIPGINEGAALSLIAEIGVDMSPWKTDKHFASWLALCPNNRISGGKVLSRKTRKTTNRARDVLRLSAQSLLRSRTALGAFCRRMCSRLGQPKGIVATAHKLALLVYRMLKFGQDYVDIGQQKYEDNYKERRLRNLQRSAREMGMELVPAST